MKSKVILIITIITTGIVLLSCTRDLHQIKIEANMVKEYNNAIEAYNKMALTFISLARTVDEELEKKSGFNNCFWDKFKMKKKY